MTTGGKGTGGAGAAAGDGPAAKLTALLEQAPPEVRREITEWLLTRGCPPTGTAASFADPWPASPAGPHRRADPTSEHVRRLVGTLAPGEGSQLVTIRLPAERHADLRTWCAAHGFSMAAVVRGLVERFLEQQTPTP